MKSTRRTADQMYPIVEKYLATNKSQRLFCEENDLEVHSFRYWLNKYRIEIELIDKPTFSKVELELPQLPKNILIRTKSGLEIEIPL